MVFFSNIVVDSDLLHQRQNENYFIEQIKKSLSKLNRALYYNINILHCVVFNIYEGNIPLVYY